MADNVSKNVSIKTSVDTSDIVNKIAQLGTVGESSADKLKPLFTGLSADAAAAAIKIDELVEAYDRFVNKAAGAASRGTGARYADDLQTTSYQLEDLRRQYSNTSTFTADSQQAKEYAANLAVVERALANIDAIQSRINAQATVSATFKHQGRHLFDTLNAEQQARAMGNISKLLQPEKFESRSLILDRINAGLDADQSQDEAFRLRNALHEMSTRSTPQKTVYGNDDFRREVYQEVWNSERANRARSQPMYDASQGPAGLSPAAQQYQEEQYVKAAKAAQLDLFARQNATLDKSKYVPLSPSVQQEQRERIQAEDDAIREQDRLRQTLEESERRNPSGSRRGPDIDDGTYKLDRTHGATHQYPRTDPDSEADSKFRRERYEIRKSEREFYKALDDDQFDSERRAEHRERLRDTRPMYESTKGPGTRHDPDERLGRRAFMGQQLAFGIDDALQQALHANSPAGAIRGATLAAGNNLTAILGAMNIAAGPMVAGMIGVQAASAGLSYMAGSYEQAQAKAADTTGYRKAITNRDLAVRRNQSFNDKMRYGSADSIAQEMNEEDSAAEARKIQLEDARRENDEKVDSARVYNDDPRRRSWYDYAASFVPGTRAREEYLRSVTAHGELVESHDRLSALEMEEMEYERRAPERKAALERGRAYERRKVERNKRDSRRVSGFFGNLQDNESITGVIMSGDEMADAYYDELGYGVDTGVEGDMEMRKQDQDRRRNFAIRSQQKSATKTNRAMDSRWQYRDDPNARFKVEYEDTAESIDEDFAMLSQEERDGMKEKAMRQRDFNIFQNNKAMATNLYRSYQTLEGDDLNAGSVGDARLRAKLSMPDPAQEENSKKFDEMASSLKAIERDIARMAGNQNQVVQMV